MRAGKLCYMCEHVMKPIFTKKKARGYESLLKILKYLNIRERLQQKK
jgi:hypothetical protein